MCITMHGSENVKFHYRIHQCPPPVPFLSQLHPAHTSTSHLPSTHFSEIVSNTNICCILLRNIPLRNYTGFEKIRHWESTLQSVGKIYLWLVLMHCLVLSLFYIRIKLNAATK